jgi:hypothetical protein
MLTYSESNKDNVEPESSVDLADYIFDIEADKEIVEAITILEGQILPLFIPII